MIKLKHYSIKSRLIAIQMMTTAAVLVFSLFCFGLYDMIIFSSYLVDELSSTATLISSNTASTLIFKDNKAAEQALSTLEMEDNIVNAWIHDAGGSLFARYSREDYRDYPFPYPDQTEKKVNGCIVQPFNRFIDKYIIISKDITDGDDVLGTLSLRMSVNQYRHIAVRGAIVIILVFVMGLALALLLSLYHQGSISKPVLRLAAAGQKVTATGDYSTRVTKEGHDEIGILYDVFNTMLQQIQMRESQRDQAERSLRESERRFKTLVANLPGATYRAAYNANRTMDFISAEIKNISGYPTEVFLNDHSRSFTSIISEEDKAQVEENIRLAVLHRRPFSLIYRIRHIDGETRWAQDRGQAIFSESGDVICVDGAVFDITVTRKAEDLARRQREELLHTDKMTTLGILVSGIAHEINNPNNFMLLNSNNLSDIWHDLLPVLDKHQREYGDFFVAGLPYLEIRQDIDMLIKGITEGSGRIKKIVESLKDFARKDQGSMNQQVHVNNVIDASLTIPSNMVKKSTDHLMVAYCSDLPPVKGNIQQIEQVIINLISNACQALTSRANSISITTARKSGERRVVVVVKDEGQGIPAENLKHIMDPFFTTKRDIGGTGLGLSISYNIIKDHGGELRIQSEPGKGTTAIVELPEEV